MASLMRGMMKAMGGCHNACVGPECPKIRKDAMDDILRVNLASRRRKGTLAMSEVPISGSYHKTDLLRGRDHNRHNEEGGSQALGDGEQIDPNDPRDPRQ